MTDTAYFDRYENLAFSRDDDGVLVPRFHTNGGPIVFTGTTHRDLPDALEEVRLDPDNRALVLTGTGDSFMEEIDGPSLGDMTKPAVRTSISHPSARCTATCRIPRSGSLLATGSTSSGRRWPARHVPSGCCGPVNESTRRLRFSGEL